MSATHVIVIGGGYAGTLAANRLRRHPDIAVSLVNPRPQFIERIRLHQYATGNHPAAVDFTTLLAPGVQLVVDAVTDIDAGRRRVGLTSGQSLTYDYLVYAAGSRSAPTTAVPGATEFAYPLAEFEDAQRLRAALKATPEDAPVCVVGGGLTGIEAATELAEAGRPVTLICGGRLAPSIGARARRSTARTLRRLAVTVREADTVSAVGTETLTLADGTVLPSAITVWTVGFGVPTLAAAAGLTTDDLGRVVTDATLTSVDDPRIVAAGDAVAPEGRPLRMSCQAAGPLGAQAADTVAARLTGRTPAALDQAMVAQCISLGRRRGTIQLARRDDTPLAAFVAGRPAAAIKEAICRGTVWAIRREARSPGSYRWLKGGIRPAPAEQEELV